MTFRQLVVKNLLANLRSYVAYFLCVLFSMFIFFLFSAIWFVPDFTEQTTEGMRQIVVIGWVITVVFSLLMIGYAHNQFLKTRAPEFGILLACGLLFKDIRNMVIIENTLIYSAALLGAFVSGSVFSKLFFLVTTNMLGIEHIKFSLTVESFVLTAASFVPVLSVIIFLTIVNTKKLTVVSVIKANKQKEPMGRGRWGIGLTGLVIIVVTLVGLYLYTEDTSNTANMMETTFAAMVLVLVGLYFLIRHVSRIFYGVLRKKSKKYYENLLNISEFSYRYVRIRTVIFIICMLSFGGVLFTTLAYTLYNQSYETAEKEQIYDVILKDFAAVPFLKNIPYDEILSASEAKVEQKALLHVVYLNAPNIKNDPWRQNRLVPVTSAQQYNKIFNSDIVVEEGHAISIVFNKLENEDRTYFRDKIVLENIKHTFSYHHDRTKHHKIFDRYAFGQPVLVLVDEEEFAKLADQTETMNQGTILLYKFDDWTKSGEAVDELAKEFQSAFHQLLSSHPQEVKEIKQRHPYAFEVMAKSKKLEHTKHVGGFALFIMSFISFLFIAAVCILVYFKVFSDYGEDQRKISILSTIGITSDQVRSYLYGKLKMMVGIPVVSGTLLALAFSISLNLGNVIEMEISNYTILMNCLMIGSLYLILIFLYYNWLKRIYFKMVYSQWAVP